MIAKRLHPRLFLEGIEIPVVSAQVTAGVNQPASAVMQIVPTDDVHNLLPRTLVHLFFLDLHPDEHATMAVQEASTGGYSGLTADLQEALGDSYRLLFAGEIVGYSFSASTGQKSAVIQCLDFSSYWDAAKQYYASGSAKSGNGNMAAFIGAGAVGISEEENGSAVEQLVSLLTSKPASVLGVDGALGGIIRLLESIGGIYRGGQTFRGLNDFFSAAELRLRLSQTLGVPRNDTTSKNLLDHKSFRKWIKATLGRSRSIVSYRQVLEIILARVFHEYVSVPAPPMREGRKETLQIRVPIRARIPKSADEYVQRRVDALTEFIDASDSTEGVLPDVVAQQDQNSDAASEDVRHIFENTDSPQNPMNLATGSDEQFIAELELSSEGDGAAMSNSKLKSLAKETRKKYLRGAGVAGYKTVSKTVFTTDRLISHIFRPGVYFCAPPRCNVFFPDNYSSFDYQRSYLEEITRLQVTTQKEVDIDSLSPDTSQTVKYWAPNIETGKGMLAAAAKKGARFIFPHERFVGIIPDFQSVPDIVAFQKMEGKTRPKIPYMQRVASYNFFERRFGPRVGSLVGPFNPYVVPGMPALIIAQHRADKIRIDFGIAPTQYLGMPMTVSHTLSQSGGTSTFQFTHCRTHNERLEFLGPFIHTFWEAAGSRTFEMVLDGAEFNDTFNEEAAMGGLDGSPDSSGALSAVGLEVDITKNGKKVGKANVKRVLSTFAESATGDGVVVEAVQSVYAKRQLEIPPDQALFPPWMSPIYGNLEIGPKFYEDLLQIGSICDPLSAVSPNGTPTEVAADAEASASRAEQYTKGGLTDQAMEAKSDVASINAANEASIEQAVDRLVAEYAMLKESGFDFDAYYKAYAWRPVATLRQVFGAYDFDLDKQEDDLPLLIGSIVGEENSVNAPEAEGFHSRAFGPYDNMEFLGHPSTALPGGSGEAKKVNAAADPRGERHRRVQAYAAVLRSGVGLLA